MDRAENIEIMHIWKVFPSGHSAEFVKKKSKTKNNRNKKPAALTSMYYADWINIRCADAIVNVTPVRRFYATEIS